METARVYVSKIRGLLKLNNVDQLVTDRLILQELLDVNAKIISQQLSKRQGTNSPNLFTKIPCLKMEQVPLYSCCNTTSDCNISRSKNKIPAIIDTNYDSAIEYVMSIDRKVKFNQLESPDNLVNLLKIYPNKPIGNHFWIQNNYIYVTSPDIEQVTISAFFKDLIDPDDFSCSSTSKTCPTNRLDLEFKTLSKLEEDITTITTQNILRSFSQIRQERTSDNLEGN